VRGRCRVSGPWHHSLRAVASFDAVLVVSFGGPEGPDEILPFLENVLRDRPVPRDRMLEVAAHYRHFGGVSPINAQNRALVAALGLELTAHGLPLPVYWGNRNWRPLLTDTVRQMAADGIRRAAVFVTSAYGSPSGCRQYLDDLETAHAAAGDGAPELVKLRLFFNHPGFIEPLAAGLRQARAIAGHEAPVLMSAHSIPEAMAARCGYRSQLLETARLVAERSGDPPPPWSLVFQSRSGPPAQPWLGPDLGGALDALGPGTASVVVVPIGFVSDHMEVVYDLDVVAAGVAQERGLAMVRAPTPGVDGRFVTMIRQLVEEADDPSAPRLALGRLGPAAAPCPPGCCVTKEKLASWTCPRP